jgi:GDP-L-fucose synthase
MEKKRIFIAGHKGMVGSALVRALADNPKNEIITRDKENLNLLQQNEVFDFFKNEQVDEVYLSAAKVGGIHANNTFPAQFIYENLTIQNNVIHGAHISDVQKLVFLGSSCIYPRMAEQPMTETALLTGPLESTNEPYAIAKIAGIKMCESYNRQYGRDYRSVMPTNLYGQNDNFHPENSHVIPALLRRFHNAKVEGQSTVVAWGSGKPKREFLHVDDMAAGSIFVMNLEQDRYQKAVSEMNSHINIGMGKDSTIRELVELVAEIVEYKGNIEFDTSKPDGPPRKIVDTSLISKLGWEPKISLRTGLLDTYKWFLANQHSYRK